MSKMSCVIVCDARLAVHQKWIPLLTLTSSKRDYSRSTNKYAKYYKILNLPDNCDQEQLRQAYLTLVKKFHPDSDSPEADGAKFQEVENAYRTLLRKMSVDRWNHQQSAGEYGLYYKEKKKSDEEVQVFDIKHTAPQHRQYLSFEGYGMGTPQQREKQYYKHRTVVAAENIYNHRVEKLARENEEGLVVLDKKEAKKIKTRYGIDRLVEDLIQESMAKGEFDNLKGKGKPLEQQNYNPYVDFTTHKLNQVLIENGFTPEWITLQKEIGEDKAVIMERVAADRALLGPPPLRYSEEQKWKSILRDQELAVKDLNSKIIKFNLLVPLLNKQMFLFNLEKSAEKILLEGKFRKDVNNDGERVSNKLNSVSSSGNQNFFSLLGNIFR
ncbi:dnaJ homolog subfamily C member 28 [Ischnura elegans]|uniref:dnaJ homolog subfamily C member 28 n=1 Tax=Ischnura elegans TaxID=197161 RepID=UPI001ED8B297|nr:dnaJ homolog subfamily C member 28 [Ischnura elegans]